MLHKENKSKNKKILDLFIILYYINYIKLNKNLDLL
ncbi:MULTISPECIES: hypothetical protein [unclassified Clostridioides]